MENLTRAVALTLRIASGNVVGTLAHGSVDLARAC
jgi:hypothetical protein